MAHTPSKVSDGGFQTNISGVLFSDVFGVEASDLESYGAIDLSLVGDLPLFVDPFLLFHSEKEHYQALHKDIIRYIRFLRDQSVAGVVNDHLLRAWFYFKEVDQTWLGFAVDSNRGSGLGGKFAHALRANFGRLLDPEQESITKEYHLEKLCLIADGVGRDRISDFTTNLIKGFLCEFTQEFSKRFIDPSLRQVRAVEKAEFNYTTRAWMTKRYDLPVFQGDYVLLVPADILARDDTWINNSDLADQFHHLPASLPDPVLRAQVDDYFRGLLPEDEEPTAKEQQKAMRETLLQFPQLVDYYILHKEQTGDRAKSISDLDVEEVRQFFLRNARQLAALLDGVGYYDVPADSYENALARARFLKHVIEDQDGYRFFWDGDVLLPRRESDVQRLFKLTWFRSAFDANAEVNNGRGPVDFKASLGSADKSLIEFKLASNKKLKQNLESQLPVYEAANDTKKSIKVIVFFTGQERERVLALLEGLGLGSQDNIVLIDARNDNKPSGSNAKTLFDSEYF